MIYQNRKDKTAIYLRFSIIHYAIMVIYVT